MNFYKHPDTNIVHAFEDGAPAKYIGEKLVAITEKQAQALQKANQRAADEAAFAALTYGQKRAAEYPPITDYLDGLVKGDVAQQQAYLDACRAVKAKYTKQ